MVAYGIAVLVLGIVVLLSRDRTTLIMSLIIGGEWLICNAAVGHDRFYLANPATIATVAMAVTAMSKFVPVNRLTLTLVALYAMSMGLAVWAAFAGATLAVWYFWAINGIFALRLLTVGGWGVVATVRTLRDRRSMGADRALLFPARRATISRRRAF